MSADSSPSPDILRRRLAAIVASCDDAIVSKDLDGVVDSWNPAAERIFGYTAAEMIGRPIALLVPPDRPDEEAQILARIRRGEAVDHFQTVRIRKDGGRIPVMVTISPIHDATGRIVGASKIARDLSRTTLLEAHFAAIVASSDDAIISKDLSGIVQSWNAAAERIFGYTAAEMIGQSITRLLPTERLREETEILARLERGERVDHFETVRRHKHGVLIDVSVTISPIKEPTGKVVGASKIVRDITQLKRSMAERQQLLESELAARTEAERTNRIKDEFLATLSHELRTPLNAIMGWATLLLAGNTNPAATREGLETISRNARAQARLIDDLLDVSRIISGNLRLDVRPVEPAAVIRFAVEAMVPAAEAKGIRIVTVADQESSTVTGDVNRLQQVVWNLLSNAIKFTPRGGRVQVLLERVESQVEITVSDTGEGIAPDFLPYLFSRFSQADQTITRRHGGLGLGLAIVRHLVELHGGSVRATSAGKGQGATFVVSLPSSHVRGGPRAPEPASVDARAELMAPAATDLSGVRVLIVDDQADARLVVQRVLESNGARVETAASAADGLDLLQRGRPDVLLCDIGMPGEDGYQLLRRLRQLDPASGGDTPAVALTALARPEDRHRALLAGFQMHLAKPVEAAELVAVVASFSHAARRARPGAGTQS